MFAECSWIAAKSMKRKSFKFAGMTTRDAEHRLLQTLMQLYEPREAKNITDWVMEHLTGQKKIDRLLRQEDQLGTAPEERLDIISTALRNHQPVQYVLGEAWFAGMRFRVDEHVLIPRPETEELVQWIADDYAGSGPGSLLDAGTGSGCIAIALRKALPLAAVWACDISGAALELARINAADLGASVDFFPADILDPENWPSIPPINVLVSNPPYIPLQEKAGMQRNVVDYEPLHALFVDDADPQVFYRALAGIGLQRLLPGGRVYVEAHEDLAEATATVFREAGFDTVDIKKDLQGKDRMVRALLHS